MADKDLEKIRYNPREHRMAVDETIRITVVGSEGDEGDVRFSEFLEQLGAIRDALRETELSLYGKDAPGVEYRIVGLSHDSPATLRLKPIYKRGQAVKSRRVPKQFVSAIRTIKAKHRAPVGADLSTLESYKNIVKPMHKHVQRVEIAVPNTAVVSIDKSFQQTVVEVIGPDIRSNGSISGKLERINLHNANVFDIYPGVGPRRVRCQFDEANLENVRSGLRRHVTVHGHLRHKAWDKFPYAIDVERLDVHEPDSDLPSIFELQGLVPGITGELSSDAFVRMIRESDWQS